MQNFYLSKLDAFDSIENVRQNSEKGWIECIQEIIRSRPYGDHKFYIFSFYKRVDDGAGIKKMYHQPRLTKPEPLPGTTLMRVDPRNPEVVTIIWTLPNQENFNLYRYGKMFSDPFVWECIDTYLHNPEEFMRAEEGDLSDEEIRKIYISKRKK